MKRILMGCTVAALVAISAHTEASPSKSFTLASYNSRMIAQLPLGDLGLASWYGEEFQGSPTASGEMYDMNGLTAAHRTLPLGTKLKVTNLRNNRSLVVRINDRGPFIHNRLLDVSMAAARKLGFKASGLALVRMQVVSYPKVTDPN
ncbi:MAG TPA: septal ring lytic transglycosylase RlpA family protein [Terriglobia bacterium]|nr:septal ring lytic transglycosylase RlpA family protein [Terriglobia bacterium]